MPQGMEEGMILTIFPPGGDATTPTPQLEYWLLLKTTVVLAVLPTSATRGQQLVTSQLKTNVHKPQRQVVYTVVS